MARRKTGNVITLSGLKGDKKKYVDFITKITERAGDAQRCKCVVPYREALTNATGFHIASMLGDDNEAEWFTEAAEKYVGRLNKCLQTCDRSK